MHYLTLRARLISFTIVLIALFSLVLTFPQLSFAASTSKNLNKSASYVPAPDNTAVLTSKNDVGRTGLNNNETILTKANVNVNQFGRRITLPVDGEVYAQPLHVPNLSIDGALHNVVFVATEHDSVYAFDADATASNTFLWHTSLLNPGETTLSNQDVNCGDTVPEVGITGTPVIDKTTNTMYVVSYSNTTPGTALTPVYRLHALDLTTGKDKSAPAVITASVPGNGTGSVNGQIPFNALRERQRAALLLTNGQVYIPFASFCDNNTYQGAILSYSYNGTAFQQQHVYNAAPNGTRAGIWGSGNAVAADNNGNIYFTTGNGDFNLNAGGTEAGDSFIKLNANLQQQDYFTPFNQKCLDLVDDDLGSGGTLVLSAQNEVISAGKEGRVYAVNSNNMGKFTENPKLTQLLTGSTVTGCGSTDAAIQSAIDAEIRRVDIDKVSQELPPRTLGGGLYSSPAYWKSTDGEYVYFAGNGDKVKAFQLNNGNLSNAPTSQSSDAFIFPNGNPVISSNGTSNATGILWLVERSGVLHAYDAGNLGVELYNSNQNAQRDALGTAVKFAAPTVANGKVFVGTSNALIIYGLDPSASGTEGAGAGPVAPPYNNVGTSDDNAPNKASFNAAGDSYSSQELARVGINPGDNVFYQIADNKDMVFTWPNVLPGNPNNYVAGGQTLTIPLSPSTKNPTMLGFLGASSDGATSGKVTINYTDGSSTTASLGFSPWTLNGGTDAPSFDNGVKATMNYRNPGGPTENQKAYVFFAGAPLDPTRTPKSVTLPINVEGPGQMHIFTISADVVNRTTN